MAILEVKTLILAGGRIEIQAPDLPEGREATVQIRFEDETPRRRISGILADDPGGLSSRSIEVPPTGLPEVQEVTLGIVGEEEVSREK